MGTRVAKNLLAQEAAVEARGEVVLVVDDEPAFCAVLGEILEVFGFSVRQAHNVAQAQDLLAQERPRLILTDVMMPEVDGITFIRQLRASPAYADLPIVAVSAKALPEDARAAHEAGASAYLVKPFSTAELRETIQRVLGRPRNGHSPTEA